MLDVTKALDRVAPASILLLAVSLWLTIAPLAAAAEPAKSPPDEAVFELDEVDVLDLEARERTGSAPRVFIQSLASSGQRAYCETTPKDRAQKYPRPKSEHPWYGMVRFGGEYFIEDSGRKVYFVVDESQGTGKGFDRVYLDLDGDGDLTNNSPVSPMKDPPKALVPSWEFKECTVFDAIEVPFDFGSKLGQRPVRIVPRFLSQEYEGKTDAVVSFVATTARAGSIKFGPRRYRAVLAQRYLITGRFDQLYTHLLLLSEDKGTSDRVWNWIGCEELRGLQRFGDDWYALSTTPLGDKLSVKWYTGPLGTFQIGPGKRELDKMSVRGSVQSETAAVPVGGLNSQNGDLLSVAECRLPVGNYKPSYLTVEYGRLRISLSENYHSDGHPRDRQNRPWVYAFQIRQERPFVLDFSHPPEVLFASPAKEKTFAPGDEVEVKAVLVDPELDIMLRRLSDTSRQKEETIKHPDGREEKRKSRFSLDPLVKITDPEGKVVSEGPMPFG